MWHRFEITFLESRQLWVTHRRCASTFPCNNRQHVRSRETVLENLPLARLPEMRLLPHHSLRLRTKRINRGYSIAKDVDKTWRQMRYAFLHYVLRKLFNICEGVTLLSCARRNRAASSITLIERDFLAERSATVLFRRILSFAFQSDRIRRRGTREKRSFPFSWIRSTGFFSVQYDKIWCSRQIGSRKFLSIFSRIFSRKRP